MWMNWNLKFSFALCLVYLFNRLWPIICPIRLGLIPTTKFYMHDMQIKEMQPSNGFCRQAVNLIEMLDQCCLEQILSSMNTILGQLQGNYEFIFPQQCSLKYKVIFLYEKGDIFIGLVNLWSPKRWILHIQFRIAGYRSMQQWTVTDIHCLDISLLVLFHQFQLILICTLILFSLSLAYLYGSCSKWTEMFRCEWGQNYHIG